MKANNNDAKQSGKGCFRLTPFPSGQTVRNSQEFNREAYVKFLGRLFAIFALCISSLAIAQGNPPAKAGPGNLKGLDTRIQDLKKQVLKLNRDLFILEEELLFPSTSTYTIFLSMDVGQLFKLDSVQVKIDNKTVANYLYTNREINALYKGGIQRLHVGNIKTGQHELTAFFIGKGPKGRDYKRGATITFEKKPGAKYIELQITDSEQKRQPLFRIKNWD